MSRTAEGTGPTKRILVVDDQPVYRLGMVALTRSRSDIEVAADVSTGAMGMEWLGEHTADLIISDLSLRDMSGFELLRRVHAEVGHIPILLVSTLDEDIYAHRALEQGAAGYLMKSVDPSALLEGIVTALAGEVVLSARASRLSKEEGRPAKTGVHSLTNRELEVFELLGQGYGTRATAERLGISVKTVETHQSNLKAKLGLGSANELVRAAVRWFYALAPRPPVPPTRNSG